MSLALFITGIAALLATLVAIFRVRHPATLMMVVMMAGWLASELAMFHLALQVIVTALFIAFGALDSTLGVIGLVAMVLSWLGLVVVQVIAGRARGVLADSLQAATPEAADRVRAGSASLAVVARPFHFDKTGIEVERGLAYGPEAAHRFDLYRPAASGVEPRPVMVYIHGGGWVSGKKEQQGLPMMHALAKAGWVCIGIDYRMGKQHRFPAEIDDVKLALVWVAEHIGEYGGDPSFIAVSGGSAGGHLASLAALDPESAPLIKACVPIYGVYDFTDHLNIRGYARMRPFLERMVMPMKQADDPDFWQQMSPIFRVDAAAAPFFIVQGALDVLAWREEAQAFTEALSAVSQPSVSYAELPGTQHTFELFNSVRSTATVDAIVAFCADVHSRQSASI
ncbi:MAG: alpha/beta hydrolase [Acidimicrobiia bacterium]|nr:alpha/beta hydrolase [Acidimicrobiia bacterium]